MGHGLVKLRRSNSIADRHASFFPGYPAYPTDVLVHNPDHDGGGRRRDAGANVLLRRKEQAWPGSGGLRNLVFIVK